MALEVYQCVQGVYVREIAMFYRFSFARAQSRLFWPCAFCGHTQWTEGARHSDKTTYSDVTSLCFQCKHSV